MTKSTVKLTDSLIQTIKTLRQNGASYRQIADALSVGYGTVQKYAKNIQFLPQSIRKNPFDLLSKEISKKTLQEALPDPKDFKDLANKEYWLEQHTPGERYKGPLNILSLTELQELMEEPTDYHSDLSMRNWALHYLSGPRNFLLHPPQVWGEGQLKIMDYWELYRRLMLEYHRGFGKTVGGDGICLHEICEHREGRYAIVSETDRKARDRVRHVGDMLIRNPMIIADYGFLPHQKIYKGTRQAWTKDKITVKREISQTDPTLASYSSESQNITGVHLDGIIFDDVWSRKLDRNLANKDKWLEWFDGELEGCLEDSWELWLLTRKGVTDLYQNFEDRDYYVVMKTPAFIKYPSKYHYEYKEVDGSKFFDKVVIESDDWEISDPTRFTPEFFLEKKLKMNATEWESEFQLNPRARSGRYWKWSDLQFIDNYTEMVNLLKQKPVARKARLIGAMDMASGTSARADYTALVIICILEQKFYFLELYLKRGAGENDIVQMLAEAKRTFGLDNVYVEADFQQATRIKEIQKKAGFIHLLPVFARQEQKQLEKMTPENKETNLSGKPLRIWAQLEGLIADHKLYINSNMHNFKEFKDEFITFPRCEHFDVLDALGSGVSQAKIKSALLYALSG